MIPLLQTKTAATAHTGIFASVTKPFSHSWAGPGDVSVTPVIVDICLVCRCENLTMGAGRYILGRAPNSNVLYAIVHEWGTPVQVSGGIARLVQNNGIVKSEPKYLACEESPICAF